ncbi:MAG: alpha/beta hydrolase [Chitinophagales bacterium]|nr:alpha/beta hydrolase [Chitinophagales bacterium]
MNWKTKLVLLFAKLQKPISVEDGVDIMALRKKSSNASKLGVKLFDKNVNIATTYDAIANGVPVRIYKNSEAKNQRVIVFYHGGGFVLYDVSSHDNCCRKLCKMNNSIVVSVDYRLAPECPFPAAHEDAFTALQWVRENAEQLGANASDMIVAGDSAGGNLAACMAHRCRKENIPLKGQVLVYPWIDGKLNNPSIKTNGEGYLLEKRTMFWFQQQYTPRPEDHCVPEVSPCYESDFTGLAPAFILTAAYDPLLDDGVNYFHQLQAAGIKATYKCYPELFHGFFNIPGIDPVAIQSYTDIQLFLAEL